MERERRYLLVSKQDYAAYVRERPPSPEALMGDASVDLLDGVIELPEGKFDLRSFVSIAKRVEADWRDFQWRYYLHRA